MQTSHLGKDGMDWCLIASVMEGRTSRQCRERFFTHVDENVNTRPWADEEDRIIITCHADMGTARGPVRRVRPCPAIWPDWARAVRRQ